MSDISNKIDGILTINNMYKECLEQMIVEAKAKNLWIEISDGRFFSCGIPSEVTIAYVKFSEGYEIVKTGDINGPATEYEQMVGTHVITWQATPAFRLCRKFKK